MGTTTFGDRYELQVLLATGGMGQVWRARDLLLQRTVAVKVLRSEFTGDPTFLARFRAEAQHTAVLAHRNIAGLYDYGEVPAGKAGHEHLAYLVMELVEGESLAALLTRERRLDAPRTLEILRQTAAALGAAHASGVVHRDVKPGNVLVAPDGTVKITDFGIAWSASSVPLTQTGQIVGTAQYLAPEQAAGDKAGPASDVYALGMIGYECLAGRRAFDGENSVQVALRQIRDVPDPLPGDVPAPVRTLIERALVKDPADRFPDGAAFSAAVEDVQAGRALPPAPAPPTRTLPLPGGRRRRSRVRALVPVAALVAGAAMGITALQVLGDPGTPAPVAAVVAPGPRTVVLTASTYLGRPVGDVENALAGLGLRVQRTPQQTAAVAAGRVTAVGPTGMVTVGELITVTYAVAPPVTPATSATAAGATAPGATAPAGPAADVAREVSTLHAAVVPGPSASSSVGISPGPSGKPAHGEAPGKGKRPKAHDGKGHGKGHGGH